MEEKSSSSFEFEVVSTLSTLSHHEGSIRKGKRVPEGRELQAYSS